MSVRLSPCSACSRHIRVDAERCPFCTEPNRVLEPAVPASSARLGSLALMTFRAATLGVALTACGGESNEPSAQGGASASGGAAGSATTGGVPDTTGSGGTRGSSNANGGTTDVNTGGTDAFGGVGNGIPIYRATPRG